MFLCHGPSLTDFAYDRIRSFISFQSTSWFSCRLDGNAGGHRTGGGGVEAAWPSRETRGCACGCEACEAAIVAGASGHDEAAAAADARRSAGGLSWAKEESRGIVTARSNIHIR